MLGTATLPNGQATFSTSALGLGWHDIIAIYTGDSTFASSASDLQQDVTQGGMAPASTVRTVATLAPAGGQRTTTSISSGTQSGLSGTTSSGYQGSGGADGPGRVEQFIRNLLAADGERGRDLAALDSVLIRLRGSDPLGATSLQALHTRRDSGERALDACFADLGRGPG